MSMPSSIISFSVITCCYYSIAFLFSSLLVLPFPPSFFLLLFVIALSSSSCATVCAPSMLSLLYFSCPFSLFMLPLFSLSLIALLCFPFYTALLPLLLLCFLAPSCCPVLASSIVWVCVFFMCKYVCLVSGWMREWCVRWVYCLCGVACGMVGSREDFIFGEYCIFSPQTVILLKFKKKFPNWSPFF